MGSPRVLALGTLAMFKYDETKTLAGIRVPVLVICGHSDIVTLPVASQRMKAELPKGELITLEPGGHMALMEKNQEFAEVIRAFCAARS